MSNTNPYNQYKQTQITTANQGKLIVMLYDGAIKFLNIALDNMSPKSYDVVNNNIIKAQDIITELLLSLNMDEGGEISQNLFNLYMYFKRQLLEANICCSDYSYEEAVEVIHSYLGREVEQKEMGHYVGYVSIASYYWYVWALYQEIRGNSVGDWLYMWYKNSKIYARKAMDLLNSK